MSFLAVAVPQSIHFESLRIPRGTRGRGILRRRLESVTLICEGFVLGPRDEVTRPEDDHGSHSRGTVGHIDVGGNLLAGCEIDAVELVKPPNLITVFRDNRRLLVAEDTSR